MKNGAPLYVACGHWDYEGFAIIAICDTKKGAEEAIKDAKRERAGYDSYEIQEELLTVSTRNRTGVKGS